MARQPMIGARSAFNDVTDIGIGTSLLLREIGKRTKGFGKFLRRRRLPKSWSIGLTIPE